MNMCSITTLAWYSVMVLLFIVMLGLVLCLTG